MQQKVRLYYTTIEVVAQVTSAQFQVFTLGLQD